MEFYYSKKKIFTSIFLSAVSLLALIGAIIYIIEYANDDYFDGVLSISVLFLGPGALIAAVYMGRSIYLLLNADKPVISMNEQGISARTTKAWQIARVIRWDEISKITPSTDNMNKSAIKITLSGHICSMYEFYITTQEAKKLGLPLGELYNKIIAYYNANKR